MDRDGDLDVVSADADGSDIKWFRNNGNASNFSDSDVTLVANNLFGIPLWVTCADLDGDGVSGNL